MDYLETVEGSGDILDPIYQKQKEGVARMRTSLLACADNPTVARTAINNITVLRIYHQIARIIKYLEMMDKIEQTMYDAIDMQISKANPNSASTWMIMLDIQERLQKLMIESHKLLQPYLDLKEYSVMDLADSVEPDKPSSVMLDADAREKLRNSAQAVLIELNASGGANDI